MMIWTEISLVLLFYGFSDGRISNGPIRSSNFIHSEQHLYINNNSLEELTLPESTPHQHATTLMSLETPDIAVPSRLRRCGGTSQHLERRRSAALERNVRTESGLDTLMEYHHLMENVTPSHHTTKRDVANVIGNEPSTLQAEPVPTASTNNEPIAISIPEDPFPKTYKEKDLSALKQYLELLHQKQTQDQLNNKYISLPTDLNYQSWENQYGQNVYNNQPWENQHNVQKPEESFGNNPKWHYSYGAPKPEQAIPDISTADPKKQVYPLAAEPFQTPEKSLKELEKNAESFPQLSAIPIVSNYDPQLESYQKSPGTKVEAAEGKIYSYPYQDSGISSPENIQKVPSTHEHLPELSQKIPKNKEVDQPNHGEVEKISSYPYQAFSNPIGPQLESNQKNLETKVEAAKEEIHPYHYQHGHSAIPAKDQMLPIKNERLPESDQKVPENKKAAQPNFAEKETIYPYQREHHSISNPNQVPAGTHSISSSRDDPQLQSIRKRPESKEARQSYHADKAVIYSHPYHTAVSNPEKLIKSEPFSNPTEVSSNQGNYDYNTGKHQVPLERQAPTAKNFDTTSFSSKPSQNQLNLNYQPEPKPHFVENIPVEMKVPDNKVTTIPMRPATIEDILTPIQYFKPKPTAPPPVKKIIFHPIQNGNSPAIIEQIPEHKFVHSMQHPPSLVEEPKQKQIIYFHPLQLPGFAGIVSPETTEAPSKSPSKQQMLENERGPVKLPFVQEVTTKATILEKAFNQNGTVQTLPEKNQARMENNSSTSPVMANTKDKEEKSKKELQDTHKTLSKNPKSEDKVHVMKIKKESSQQGLNDTTNSTTTSGGKPKKDIPIISANEKLPSLSETTIATTQNLEQALTPKPQVVHSSPAEQLVPVIPATPVISVDENLQKVNSSGSFIPVVENQKEVAHSALNIAAVESPKQVGLSAITSSAAYQPVEIVSSTPSTLQGARNVSSAAEKFEKQAPPSISAIPPTTAEVKNQKQVEPIISDDNLQKVAPTIAEVKYQKQVGQIISADNLQKVEPTIAEVKNQNQVGPIISANNLQKVAPTIAEVKHQKQVGPIISADNLEKVEPTIAEVKNQEKVEQIILADNLQKVAPTIAKVKNQEQVGPIISDDNLQKVAPTIAAVKNQKQVGPIISADNLQKVAPTMAAVKNQKQVGPIISDNNLQKFAPTNAEVQNQKQLGQIISADNLQKVAPSASAHSQSETVKQVVASAENQNQVVPSNSAPIAFYVPFTSPAAISLSENKTETPKITSAVTPVLDRPLEVNDSTAVQLDEPIRNETHGTVVLPAKKTLNEAEQKEVDKLANQVAQEILEHQKKYPNNRAIELHSKSHTKNKNATAAIIPAKNEPIFNQTQANNEINSATIQDLENSKESDPNYPIDYLKHNIQTNEPYEVIVEGKNKTNIPTQPIPLPEDQMKQTESEEPKETVEQPEARKIEFPSQKIIIPATKKHVIVIDAGESKPQQPGKQNQAVLSQTNGNVPMYVIDHNGIHDPFSDDALAKSAPEAESEEEEEEEEDEEERGGEESQENPVDASAEEQSKSPLQPWPMFPDLRKGNPKFNGTHQLKYSHNDEKKEKNATIVEAIQNKPNKQQSPTTTLQMLKEQRQKAAENFRKLMEEKIKERKQILDNILKSKKSFENRHSLSKGENKPTIPGNTFQTIEVTQAQAEDAKNAQEPMVELPDNLEGSTVISDFSSPTEKRSCPCQNTLPTVATYEENGNILGDQPQMFDLAENYQLQARPHQAEVQTIAPMKDIKELIAAQRDSFIHRHDKELMIDKHIEVSSGELGQALPSCGCGKDLVKASKSSVNNKDGKHTCSCNRGSCEGSLLKAQKDTYELNKYDILHNMILWLKHYGPKPTEDNHV